MKWFVLDIKGNVLGTIYAPNGHTADKRASERFSRYSHVEEYW